MTVCYCNQLIIVPPWMLSVLIQALCGVDSRKSLPVLLIPILPTTRTWQDRIEKGTGPSVSGSQKNQNQQDNRTETLILNPMENPLHPSEEKKVPGIQYYSCCSLSSLVQLPKPSLKTYILQCTWATKKWGGICI